MSPGSSRAFFTSTFLHLLAVVLLLAYAFFARLKPEEKPHVFELVAGEGNNYMATAAPAATAPEVNVTLPPIPQPAPRPEPVIEPVVEPVITPDPPPVQVQPAPVPSPVQPAPRPQPAPKEPTPPRETQADRIRRQLEEQRKMSVEEFRRQNPTKSTPAPQPPRPIRTQTIDVGAITKGVTGGSTRVTAGAGGTALSRAEVDQLESYGAMISQRIRQALERAGLSDLLQVEVQFHVAANGTISGARIVQSSGSSEFDRAVLRAFATVQPIGPTPTNRAEDFRVPIRIRER